MRSSKKTPNPANPLSPTSRRARHRQEAEERKALRDVTDDAKQLATIAKRPGESRREKARILRRTGKAA